MFDWRRRLPWRASLRALPLSGLAMLSGSMIVCRVSDNGRCYFQSIAGFVVVVVVCALSSPVSATKRVLAITWPLAK